MSTPEPVRFSIQIPAWYDKRLKLWAHVKGAPRAGLAANIVQARIEANWEWVDQMLAELASDRGITREELEQEILGD